MNWANYTYIYIYTEKSKLRHDKLQTQLVRELLANKYETHRIMKSHINNQQSTLSKVRKND